MFEVSWEIMSRARDLVLQDLAKVSLLVSFVVVYRTFVSMMLFRLGAVTEASARTEKMAKQHVVFQEFSREEQPMMPCADDRNEPKSEDSLPSAGFHLLERYGQRVFGAAPGAWISQVSATVPPIEKEMNPATTIILPPEAMTSHTSRGTTLLEHNSRTPRGMSLLDQYGVFGASPKCWKGDSVDQSFAALEAKSEGPVDAATCMMLPQEALIDHSHRCQTLLERYGHTPRGMSLLEQYGVFGVSPRCWRGTRADHFVAEQA
jgi:hypothetical protein